LNQALGEKKAGGEFEIVPRRAHRHRQRRVSDANFQRLFAGDRILHAPQASIDPLRNLR